MSVSAGEIQMSTSTSRREQAPIPREHGIWALVYAPLILGLVLGDQLLPAPTAALVATVTAGLFLMTALRLPAWRRPLRWTAALALATACGGLALVIGWRLYWLAGVAALGVLPVVWERLLPPARRRGLAVRLALLGALTLSGPAAAITNSGGRLGPAAGWLWVASTAIAVSSSLHVRAVIAYRRAPEQALLATVRYHAFLTVGLGVFLATVGIGRGSLWVAAAYVPLILRAMAVARALAAGRTPSLKAVGIGEAIAYVWWATCGIALAT